MRRQERLLRRNKLKSDPALAAELAESRLQPVTYREASPTLAPAIQVSCRCPPGHTGHVRVQMPDFPSRSLCTFTKYY